MKFFRQKRGLIPILTYHSLNVLDETYEANDHLAFESDLQTIDRLGMKIVPLDHVLDWYEGRIPDKQAQGCVAITMDDGSSLDFHDVEHPTCGPQPGMFSLLQQFRSADHGSRQPSLHVSSFVISSPEAREVMDQRDLLGKGWWGDDWWAEAQASKLMSIECHSWDHAHETLDTVAQQDNIKGNFMEIRTFEDCSIQVTRAAEYIEHKSGSRPAYFAYPWGQASDYMIKEFMPHRRNEHRFRAAFSTEAEHVSKTHDIWYLPRYVCGRDWQSPDELKAILVGG